jgi:hypothetical protein
LGLVFWGYINLFEEFMKADFNLLEAIDNILNELKLYGLDYDAKYLENEVRSSATGGELCSRFGSTLLAMQNKKEVKDAIGPLIEQFVDYCFSIGLLVKPFPFSVMV